MALSDYVDPLIKYLTGTGTNSLLGDITDNAGNIALGSAGLGLLSNAYSRLGDIGDESQAGANIIAQQGLQQSQFRPFTVTSTTGSQFGFTPAAMPSYTTPYAPPSMFPTEGGGGGYVPPNNIFPGTDFAPGESIGPTRLIPAQRSYGAGGDYSGPDYIRDARFIDNNNNGIDDRDEQVPLGSSARLTLSPQEEVMQDMLQQQAESTMLGGPFGAFQRQQAAQQAFGLGGQFMGAAAQQPSDLNLLRGMFTQQAASALGGGVPPQGLSFLQEQQRQLTGGVAAGGQGQLGQLSPDVLQKAQERQQRIANAVPAGFVANSVLNPGQAIGQVAGAPIGYTNPQTGEKIFISTEGEITRRIAAPEGYQPQEMPSRFQGLREKGMSPEMLMVTSPQQAPTIGQFGQQALGLGMAGLDTQAPSDVEALRQQYTQLASQTAGRALQDTTGREADVYERIRATQRPEEERQRLALEERMAQQGRLGVRTAMFGGAPEQFSLAQAQEEAQNRASLMAMQQAQAERQQAVSEAQTFGGLFGQQAGLSSQLQSAAQQRAAQLSQLGLSAQQIESQLQSEGLGRAATSAQQAAQLAQLAGGLQAQQAGLGAQYAGLGSQLAMQDLAAQQAQQQLALGALTGSYIPQAQLMNVAQLGMTPIEMAQRGQLYGAGLFGEGSMTGLQSRLAAALGQANLFGTVGTGLLSGALGVKI